ncbi:MAG: NAD(P)H-binding protein [Pseudomonadota bacterium]
MKIALLGATGMTGRHVLAYARAQGHAIRALVRDPGRLAAADGVEIIEGSALERADLERTFEGCSAVVSALGPTNRSWKMARTGLCARVTQNVLDIMGAHPTLERYVMLSSASIAMPGDKRDINGLMTLYLGPLILGPILTDKRAERRALLASGAPWTMVRAPEIVDAPGSGAARLEKGSHGAMKVNAGDVAQVLIDQLENAETERAGVFVSADLSGRYAEIWGKA